MRPAALASLATLLLVLGGAAPVLSHAVLTKASLDVSTVRASTPTTVTLTFNAAIEPGFTRVTLVNEGREERRLEVLPQGEPAKVMVALPPLSAGTYGLRYKVLATDGHVTESLLRFKVTGTD